MAMLDISADKGCRDRDVVRRVNGHPCGMKRGVSKDWDDRITSNYMNNERDS